MDMVRRKLMLVTIGTERVKQTPVVTEPCYYMYVYYRLKKTFKSLHHSFIVLTLFITLFLFISLSLYFPHGTHQCTIL